MGEGRREEGRVEEETEGKMEKKDMRHELMVGVEEGSEVEGWEGRMKKKGEEGGDTISITDTTDTNTNRIPTVTDSHPHPE